MRRGDHVEQLHLIGGCHDDDVWQAPEEGQVEAAVVRGPVVAHQPRAVEDEAHGQVLNHHVVDHLVVAALEEGGVDGDKGLGALHGHAGGEGDGVLLGNAHVKGALGEAPAKFVHARAARHGRRDGHHGGVALGKINERVAEGRRVGELRGGGLVLATCGHVKPRHAVVFVRRGDGRRVAVALLRLDVEEHGLVVVPVADVLEQWDQRREVVSVDGPNVVEAKLLKEGASGDDAARVLVDARVHGLQVLRQQPAKGLCEGPKVQKGL